MDSPAAPGPLARNRIVSSGLENYGARHCDGYSYGERLSMTTLKLTKIGTSTGALLPREMLTHLKVEKDDRLYAIETKDGSLITPYDQAIAEEFKAGREFMKEYRDTFKAFAK